MSLSVLEQSFFSIHKLWIQDSFPESTPCLCFTNMIKYQLLCVISSLWHRFLQQYFKQNAFSAPVSAEQASLKLHVIKKDKLKPCARSTNEHRSSNLARQKQRRCRCLEIQSRGRSLQQKTCRGGIKKVQSWFHINSFKPSRKFKNWPDGSSDSVALLFKVWAHRLGYLKWTL